jgi:twinkle protein
MLNIQGGFEVFQSASLEIVNPPKGYMINAWPLFSQYTGGLRLHEFTIFCGATGSGKTQFLANLVCHLTKQKVKCFIASVETGQNDFARRMMSAAGRTDFNSGHAMPMEKFSPTIRANEHMLEHTIFSTHDNRIDVLEMVQTLQYLNEKKGVEVAVLDNLNFFLKPTKASDTLIEMDEAVHAFVMLAKKIPIHIFMVMHPKKTEGGKVLSEFDIKGSSTSVQEASNVLLFNRLNEDEMTGSFSPLTRELVFKKIRKRGAFVNKKFYMDFNQGAYDELEDRTSQDNGGIQPTRKAPGRGNKFFGPDL